METRYFNRSELQNFILSEQYARLNFIPISKHRAISQIHNPRASDDDIMLVAQFDGNKLVGYLGILPDYVFNGKEFAKAGWLSCFWVDEAYKTSQVAAGLLLSAMNLWNDYILITNIDPRLEKLYQKTGLFFPSKVKEGLRIYVRFNLGEILPPKSKRFKKITGILRATDKVLNAMADIRFIFSLPYETSPYKIEYLKNIDALSGQFINDCSVENLSKRQRTELEWIMNYPWIIEGTHSDYNGMRYYFSAFNKRFFYQLIRISNERGAIVGLTLLCVRNNSLTIPYVYAAESGYEAIAKVIVNTVVYLRLSMFTTFDQGLITALNKLYVHGLYRKRQEKIYFISKKLDFIGRLDFQDGDGDCVFY